MKIKPILFNTEMVRAILEGRKTVTRRVVKLKYSNTHLEMFTNKYGTRLVEKQNEVPGVTTIKNPDGTTTHTLLACIEKEPPYLHGDILYVRETWNTLIGDFIYRADQKPEFKNPGKWRPSIHMPCEAARIFLRVTKVYPQQLKDVTETDANAEGFNSRAEFVGAILGMYPECTEESWFWVNEFERISKESVNDEQTD